MKNKITIIVYCVTMLFLFGCKSPTTVFAGNYDYKTECIANKLDGTIVLKTWGKGFTKKEAVIQAKKNALEAVLFQGILGGKPYCDTKPIVTDVNGYEKNKVYFESFFSDKGEYLYFITEQKSGKSSIIISSENNFNIGIVVTVLKSELKEKMLRDQIIK